MATLATWSIIFTLSMFSGFVLGAMAAFFWSITNVIDQHLVSKYSPDGNIGGVLLLSCFFPGFLALIALGLSSGVIFDIKLVDSLVLILSGVLMVVWLYFYLKALTEDDAAVVMALLVLAPFFSLIFGYILLGETLSHMQMLSGLVIISGALLVSYQPATNKIKKKLLFYALGASITIALLHSLFKIFTVQEDFWQSLFWRSLGMVVSGLLLFLILETYRSHFISFIEQHLKRAVSLNTANESLTLLGDTLFAFAILFSPLAIVQASESYQPIFVILITFVLARFGVKSFLQEGPNPRWRYKLAGIILVFLGGVALAVIH